MKKKFLVPLLLLFSLFMLSAQAQKVIPIEAGTDQIAAAVAEADSGDVIVLTTDGGKYIESDRIKIKKALTITGDIGLSEKPEIISLSADRPFEPTGACNYFRLYGLKITGFLDDGITDSNDSTKYAMRVRGMDGPYSIFCEKVDFDYFYSQENPPEGYVIRIDDDAPYADEIVFKNCTFTRIGKHVFRADAPTVAPGQFGHLTFDNCTFAQVAARGLNIDLLNETGVDSAVVSLNHCTFTDIGQDAIQVNQGRNVTIDNCIFYGIGDDILTADSAQVYTRMNVSNCDTLNNAGGFSRFLDLTTQNIYAEDPEFADPAGFDFTVSSFFKDNAVGTDGMVIGDLRWDPDNPLVNGVLQIEAGTDQFSAAYDVANTYGSDVIELVTPGGTYLENDRTKIKMPLLVRGADGIEKPVIESANPDRPFEPTGDCTYFGLSHLKVTGMVDDGVTDAKDSTKYAMRIRGMNDPYILICDDVDFDYFVSTENPPEGYVLRVDDDAPYSLYMEFSNCTMTRIAKHGLRFDSPTQAPGQVGKLLVENCTFADIAARGIYGILMPAEGVDTTKVMVNHCTYYGIGQDALKINNGTDIMVKNSIFSNVDGSVLDADSAQTYTSATVAYCDTFITGGFSRFLDLTTESMFAEDPEFADPANFNFTVSEFFSGIARGDDGNVIGDSRWVPLSGIEDQHGNVAKGFDLKQNYPNPFNPSTTIEYYVPKASDVRIVVYNVIGQEVMILVNGQQLEGAHKVAWNGRDANGRLVGSGLYFFRIEAGNYVKTRKMMFLK
ncbi:MAG: right-handed parallel beta-helix repeat-containing protein [Calditrichia bacterium]